MKIEPRVTPAPPQPPPEPTVEIVVTLPLAEAEALQHLMGSNSTDVAEAFLATFRRQSSNREAARAIGQTNRDVVAYMSRWYFHLHGAIEDAKRQAADVRG